MDCQPLGSRGAQACTRANAQVGVRASSRAQVGVRGRELTCGWSCELGGLGAAERLTLRLVPLAAIAGMAEHSCGCGCMHSVTTTRFTAKTAAASIAAAPMPAERPPVTVARVANRCAMLERLTSEFAATRCAVRCGAVRGKAQMYTLQRVTGRGMRTVAGGQLPADARPCGTGLRSRVRAAIVNIRGCCH